eukprot:TRINITY_DN17666_c0_g1_i1.p1 TRINITY_DN17666_c0_g1~~TRINITY_DN17666_c0_g1_i1.p1  ORF type:complete len:333 (+),score=38.12 TRINITY_DN17666_c0_g1_i1:62-1060(+)
MAGQPQWTKAVLGLAAITIVLFIAANAFTSPERCSLVEGCKTELVSMPDAFNRYLACATATAFLLEVVFVCLTYLSIRPILGQVDGLESTLQPPILLSITLFMLLLESVCINYPFLAHVAAPGVGRHSQQPVHTVIYVEWVINTPILLLLVGKCALRRPLAEVFRPLAVTQVYIVLAWSAHYISQAPLRWAVVASAFLMYGWASWDMAMWVFKFRRLTQHATKSTTLRPGLVFGLIAAFSLYGIVYLLALQGIISSYAERVSYISMNIGVKLPLLVAFGGLRSSQYYELVIDLIVNADMPLERQRGLGDGDFGDRDFEEESRAPFIGMRRQV